MASSIGIRVYKITVQWRGEVRPLRLDQDDLTPTFGAFLSQFATHYSSSIQDNALERSWYFEPKIVEEAVNSKGYVRYGTFGFESNFVDSGSGKTNYRRRTSDVEEIPLFYEFWAPKGADFALVAFQSFQGRSCIHLVMDKLREDFVSNYKKLNIKIQKLMPNDLKGSLYFSAPIKKLTLTRHKAPTDLTDRYYHARPHTGIDFEVSLRARRNGSLGPLSGMDKLLKSDAAGVVQHDGIAFDEATAQIRFGNRTIKVGVLGANSGAGVIDLTELIERGPDGHPTFESLIKQSTILLGDFYAVLSG